MSLLVDYVLLFDRHINCLYDHTKHLYSISLNQDQPEYIHPNCYVYVKKLMQILSRSTYYTSLIFVQLFHNINLYGLSPMIHVPLD